MGANTDTPEQGSVSSPEECGTLGGGTSAEQARAGDFPRAPCCSTRGTEQGCVGTRSFTPNACGSVDTSVADVCSLCLVRSRPFVVVILWSFLSL